METLASVVKDFRSKPFSVVNHKTRLSVSSKYDIEITFSHSLGDAKCHCEVSLVPKDDTGETETAKKDYPISSPDEAHSWIKYTVDNFTTTARS